MAAAITDMHNVDLEGRPSIAHTDITPSQFLLTAEGKWKLTDFNRVRFLRKNITAESVPCSYIVGRNPGKFRSPEEYNHTEQTSAIDVYSMGNIFYSLLTGRWPFENRKTKEAQRLIKNNQRPPIDDAIRESDDPLDVAMLKAIERCWEQDPVERASAREIEKFLETELATHKNRQEKPRHSGPKKDPPIKASKRNQLDHPAKPKEEKAAKDPPIHVGGKTLKKVQ